MATQNGSIAGSGYGNVGYTTFVGGYHTVGNSGNALVGAAPSNLLVGGVVGLHSSG